ncbi:MAG: HAD-IB family hydrolase [Acidimicrobiales bacterium]|jgi:HAD superfamily hydrolase (TIGR01490 family)
MSETPPAVVAAFDLDGSLTEGGSVWRWLRYLAGTGAVFRAALPLTVPLLVGAVRSGAWADHAKERLFGRLLTGRDLEEVRDESRTFALSHLEKRGRAKVLERLHWHQSQGHLVVVVSASPQIYVDVIGEALRATGAIGTRLAVDPLGHLTGSYLGRNCRGSEKMRRLSEWIDQQGFTDPPVIYAYGNSRGDRRLLKGASHPYDVGKLGPFGALRQYPRLPATNDA